MRIAFVLVAAALVTGCAVQAAASLRNPPQLAADIPTCTELREAVMPPSGVSPTAPARTPDGWVVIAYSLAGDGVASKVRVLDSEPPGIFVQGSLMNVSRARFKHGEVRELCVSIDTIYVR
jgi:hypothetical protein